ncbi:metallophosphoesterase [Leadbettera azotonutricia]|nr:metallophosphoesterase [Leadbettera azotonutricia]
MIYRNLQIRVYRLETPLLSENTVIRIVLISDLHSQIYGKDQSPLIEKVIKLEPDLIFLTGDILDDRVPDTGTLLFLSGVKDLAPMYYVTGNHERMSRRFEERMELLRSFGVVILPDAYIETEVKGNEIIIAGLDDPYISWPVDKDQSEIMEKTFRELDQRKEYKILLAHRPERVEQYLEYSFNLIVNGHSHGGQVRIPLILNGLYAPNQGFFPKYTGGLYKHGGTMQIVSRGLSDMEKIPRIFNPTELVCIIVKSGK